jgi:hypothetical protein
MESADCRGRLGGQSGICGMPALRIVSAVLSKLSRFRQAQLGLHSLEEYCDYRGA